MGDMKRITALNMNWNEYSDIVEKATDGKANLLVTDVEWDYVCEIGYEFDVEEINEMVGKHIGEKVLDVIIDISNDGDCVIIVVKQECDLWTDIWKLFRKDWKVKEHN